MKVCIIIDSLRVGGAQRVTSDLASLLSTSDYLDVDLITYKNKVDIDIDDGINIINVNLPGLSRKGVFGIIDAVLYKLLGKFYQFFMSSFYVHFLKLRVNLKTYDHIILASDSAFFPFFKLKGKNVNFVLHSRKSKQYLKSRFKCVNYFTRLLVKNVLSDANLITVSEGIKNDAIKEFNVNEDSVRVIYNFINEKLISRKAESVSPDISRDHFRYICHVGRHSKEKRVDVLLKSFELICECYDDIYLYLVGDGPEHLRLKQIASDSKYRDKIIFTGFISNPYPYIKKSECLVLTSEREGLPTVLIESLSLNVPVVSTNCLTGPSEILTGDLSLYLCKVNDYDDIYKKVSSVLEGHYPKAYDTVEFSRESVLKKWMRVLQ